MSKRISTCKPIVTLNHIKNKKPVTPVVTPVVKSVTPVTTVKSVPIKTESKTTTRSATTKEVRIKKINVHKGRYYLDRLYYSHLDFASYKKELADVGWKETKEPKDADIIICSYWKHIMKYIPSLSDQKYCNRKLVIWTHEPYHDLHLQKEAEGVHIYNVYNGRVFKDNYRYFRWGLKDTLKELTESNLSEMDYQTQKFPLLALSTKYPKTYWLPNKLTLLPRRYELIEYGYKYDRQCKIWGKGWPDGMSVAETRSVRNREEEKAHVLRSGLFNIALENTDTAYYVTEKIWDSIESYCLPIYWANSTIYEDFPADSFIDAKLFYEKWGNKLWAEKIYECIKDMPRNEYLTRLNKCIKTFNNLCGKGLNAGLKKDAAHRDLHVVDYTRNWDEFKTIFDQVR